MKPSLLIVNADDFGRAPGLSRGIVQAHQQGIVTSTTMMVNLPSSADAARLAASVPSLGIGLHLTYCYGPALAADVPSLLGADGLLERDRERLRARMTADDVRRETLAQIARFQTLLGRLPTHLDSHQHIHTWSRVEGIVLQIAADLHVPVRSVTPTQRATLRARAIPTPDAFINTFFAPGSMTLAGLLDALRALSPGTSELMCHPGFDDEMLADSTFRAQREDEVRYLSSPEVQQLVAKSGIQLVSYAMLGDAGQAR